MACGGRVEASDSIAASGGRVRKSLADGGTEGPVCDQAVGGGIRPVDYTMADNGGVLVRVEVHVDDEVTTAIAKECSSGNNIVTLV